MEKTGKQYSNNSDYLELAANGDENATEALIKNNYTLVTSVARRFQGRGCDLEDLIQIGMIGMLKAIRSFDVSRGNSFSTYAVPMIMGEIRKFLRDDGLVKVGRKRKQNGYAIMRAGEMFAAEHGREPKLSEIAEMTNLDIRDVTEALEALTPVVSTSSLVGDSDELTIENTSMLSDNSFEAEFEKIALLEAIKCLDPTKQKIVLFRYYRNLSQQETADRLGMTQVKVSREEKKIYALLKEKLT